MNIDGAQRQEDGGLPESNPTPPPPSRWDVECVKDIRDQEAGSHWQVYTADSVCGKVIIRLGYWSQIYIIYNGISLDVT